MYVVIPGLSLRSNPGSSNWKIGLTLKGLKPPRYCAPEKPFQGYQIFSLFEPRVVAALQPWAGISERLQR
jgi:hypothetical protein